ncbi:MAG: Omp28-related outer membrane protein [Bacteroidales bacterium]|nr:Omp28-related outer membrane protein [Bacteroidales bacterium]
MKKFTLMMVVMLACLFRVNAQEPQFVSKEQQKRNVLIEELTGRLCGYCPGGQATVNQIIAKNPEKIFSVNIHAQSSLSPTNYPNLNTKKGASLFSAFIDQGIPAVVVNRMEENGSLLKLYPQGCASYVDTQLNQTAEVNMAGQVVVNPITRIATITVEAYYTGDSKSETNYLTIMMVQDSIFGSQSGATSNPAQIVNGEYCHMHTLRDIVTETWGDAIAPTTATTLLTKQYVYNIPEVIGDPNGVEVDIDNIHFLAFITEKKNGAATEPILNVCELDKIEGTDEAIYPFIKNFAQENLITCTNEKKFTANVVNGGTEVITSLKFEVSVNNGATTTHEWTGEIPVYGNVDIDLFAEVPFGGELVSAKIVEANGTPFTFEASVMGKCEEWIQVELGDTQATEEFKLELAQDRFGNQTTWHVYGHNDEVLASGGPYEMLSQSGIKVHEEYFTVKAGECMMFVIEDNVGNGITSNNFGKGYYKLYDSKGNVLIDSDGNFGHGEYHVIFLHGAMSVEDVEESSYNVFPNPVKDVLTVSGEDMKQVTIYNALGQMVKSINCNDNTVQINVNDLQNGMYIVNVINHNGVMTTSKVSVLK